MPKIKTFNKKEFEELFKSKDTKIHGIHPILGIPIITTRIDFKCSVCGEEIDDSIEATEIDTVETNFKLKPYGLTVQSNIIRETYKENMPICDHCLFNKVIEKLK